MKNTILIAAGLLAATLLVPALHAQSSGSLGVNWSTLGGGGAGAGPSFALSGTVGQPDAGVSSGDNFTLIGGFWATEMVVQTPGLPRLTLSRAGANVLISWPSSSSGFALQSTTDLGGKPVWTSVAPGATLVGNQYQVTVPASQARQFFRLVSQ